MRKSGIWLDKEKALCFAINGPKESLETLTSEVESFNVKGGSRSKTRWGPQDVVQDSKYLEREKHQLKRYFEKIVSVIKNTDEFALFGPAETADKFSRYLMEKHKDLYQKLKTLQKADSITQNQFKALVRETFEL